MKNILVIEDDYNIRESIADLLSIKNYAITQASDGIEGLHYAKKINPDLILCDIMMPGIDGHEVLKELRMKKETANIPFIFLSAKSQMTEIREGMNLGADDYLTKPFKAADLFSAVESRLNRHQINQQELEEKLAIMKPLKEAVLSDKLIQPLQGIIDISELLYKYFEKYSIEDVEEMTLQIKGRASKLKRKLRNIILFQSLEDISSRHDLITKFSSRKSFNPKNRITDQIISIAKSHQREKDLFHNILDSEVKFSEEFFNIIIEELLDNAFTYSPATSIIKISSISDSKNFRFSIKNKINMVQAVALTKVINGEFGTSKSKSKNQFGIGLKLVNNLCEASGTSSLSIRLNEPGFVTILLDIINSEK